MMMENGSEYHKMTKAEAKASVVEMGKMMEFFEGTCDLCGGIRKDCSAECVEAQIKRT